jgi:ankyrin repeat protein
MNARELPAHPNLEQYEQQAIAFLNAYNTGDSNSLELIRDLHSLEHTPTHEELRRWTSQRLLRLKESEDQSESFTLDDARALIADAHCFENWNAFERYIAEINTPGSSISQFESAVDAVVSGDVIKLRQLLNENPQLIRARSLREHGATLLHYVSANGVEDFRQKTPSNAVEVADVLLAKGAEVDADLGYAIGPAARYPERIGSTTLGLIATSIHPAHAGVQIELMETLLRAGASIDGIRHGWSFVRGCLGNGRPEAAHFLAEQGAKLDLEEAAGVGRLDLVQRSFNEDGTLRPPATQEQFEAGLMWASEFGHNSVVEFLLDKGLPVWTEVGGMTALHWAMVGGRLETARLLIDRNAPLEAENSYGGTALGCLIWAVRYSDPVYRWPDRETDWLAIVKLLIDSGAKVYESDSDFPTGNELVDAVLRAHGMKLS